MITGIALYFLILHTLHLGIITSNKQVQIATKLTAVIVDIVAIAFAILLIVLV